MLELELVERRIRGTYPVAQSATCEVCSPHDIGLGYGHAPSGQHHSLATWRGRLLLQCGPQASQVCHGAQSVLQAMEGGREEEVRL